MTEPTKAIQKIEKGLSQDIEWRDIVDRLVDEMGADLPDKVVSATEYLLAGWPTYKVAKKLGVRAETVREWLKRYPTMALTVAQGRKLLSKWRMAQLEQQYVTAVEKSEEILELDLSDREVNQKLVATIAQHSRYIIGLFAGQQIDVNVHLDESQNTLKATSDALDYIASQLQQQRVNNDVVEATYKVVDANPDVAENRPLLNEDGNPYFGQLGVLDVTDEGALCHICGKRSKNFQWHIATAHHIKVKDYELCFMLELGDLKKADAENG